MKSDNQLNEQPPEEITDRVISAVRQVALADLIIMNKIDLVATEEKDTLRLHIKSINGFAPVLETTKCAVSLDNLLDLRAYSGGTEERIEALVREIKEMKSWPHLDESVRTVTLEISKRITKESLDSFLQNLLWEKVATDKLNNITEIIRLKGLVSIEGERDKLLVQAVYNTYDSEPVKCELSDTSGCRFIFIGRNLDEEKLLNLLEECVEADSVGRSLLL